MLWRSVGPVRTSEVTAETNCFQLDSLPALQFYEQRLCLACPALVASCVHRPGILMVISSANWTLKYLALFRPTEWWLCYLYLQCTHTAILLIRWIDPTKQSQEPSYIKFLRYQTVGKVCSPVLMFSPNILDETINKICYSFHHTATWQENDIPFVTKI